MIRQHVVRLAGPIGTHKGQIVAFVEELGFRVTFVGAPRDSFLMVIDGINLVTDGAMKEIQNFYSTLPVEPQFDVFKHVYGRKVSASLGYAVD